ncbi:Dual specificity phosphatase, catalytic domain protein [Kalmanozyma brasiliensis GHG001]|uniref:protein-tyrosine-phosphatase n=1 Tax=Kalmanozyma brasiliensis (strain GHG001) TaxID=1365824 RepID=V5EUF5_KALBG|nr:Dual specificity phosphatase, catalytic domain protein [Kalmanozyma brasiliensis GHG001]EST06783.1 Dual specificity phosphatase, catalytic domain protein [Kalmanozyma brasiliensis GHG001]
MASTSAFVLEERQQHIIAPDDSDFLDSDAESSNTPHPDDQLIESAVLQDLPNSPHRSPRKVRNKSPGKLWPSHPLIRIHKRLWFTWFAGDLPSEDDLNDQDGQPAAWKNFNDAEIKKYVDASETNPSRLHWFNIDRDLVYLSFWFDWGPLNVGMFYRFCLHVHHMLTDPDMQDATLVLYTTDAPAQKANAALLVTLYAMIIGKVNPADAFYPISELEFRPFRDAGYGRADYNLSIQDILYGVHRAINEGLLDLTTFNLDEYEKYEEVSNGDWNWITPNFIAFASPNDRTYVEALRVGEGRLPASYSFHPPGEDKLFGRTIRYFKDRGVKLVVRLNNPLYDREAFLDAGIDHTDMYFDDGSNPTDEILTDFIAKADKVISQDGVVAVHCKAGLGRTGVLIGAYLVWKHGFSAGEAIGFMRFMRPGCVVGPQQHFMYQNFVEWIKWGVRDHAMKEAKLLIAEERAKIEAAAQAAAAAATAANASAAPVTRASNKRRAAADDSFDSQTDAEVSLDEDVKHAQVHKHARAGSIEGDSDEEEQKRPRQKRKSDPAAADSADANIAGPQTPRAQRGVSRGVPASAAPNVKPAPCVGQPRKSPSPSRKRPAIQAPATVARLELTSRRYPAATRSFNTHLMLSSQSVHIDAVPTTAAAPSLTVAATETAADEADEGSKVRGVSNSTTHTVEAGTGAGVLVESRINVSPHSTTPRASPKAALVNLTPSPVARVRGFERTRSNTIATATVATPIRASSRRDTASPSPKPEVFRASPSVKERYGLRDSPPPPASPPVRSAAVSRQPSPVKVMSDADVLGVIDCIPQHSPAPRVSMRHPTPSPPKPEVKEEIKVDAENVEPPIRASLTPVGSATQGPKVIRAVKPTLNGATASSARVATVRKPVTVRSTPAPTVAATSRSVSAKLVPSTTRAVAGTGLRAQKSVADLRAPPAKSRVASGVSTAATVNPVPTRPASRLTAPTAASAARAAANGVAAGRRTPLPTAGAAKVGAARKVSAALQKGGPAGTRRPRRSSTGEAGLDVVA